MTNSWERRPALFLTLWAIILHLIFLRSAGGLWRDEANSAQQALLPTWSELWRSLDYDSFPILYPALLRLWSMSSWTSSDEGMRLFGFLMGLAALATFLGAARLLQMRFPLAVLSLVAVNPLTIVEGDSIRPYGLSTILGVWTVVLLGRYLQDPRALWLALASSVAVLSVQSSYMNVLFVTSSALSATVVLWLRRSRISPWMVLLPLGGSAISLVPYLGALRNAGTWSSIVHLGTNWKQILIQTEGAVAYFAPILLGLWGLVLFLPTLFLISARKDSGRDEVSSLVCSYLSGSATLGIVSQTLLLQLLGGVPFLRYFLISLVISAFAIESELRQRRSEWFRAALLVIVLATAWPAWSWTRLRRTSMDLVTATLATQVNAQDLVIVCPWFLGPSFSRYYRGSAPWIAVPDLGPNAMMRYDLLRLKIIRKDPDADGCALVEKTLQKDGIVWLVTQQYLERRNPTGKPEPVVFSGSPRGHDYTRVREFWERSLVFCMASGADNQSVAIPVASQVWHEERLSLVRWRKKP